VYQFDLQTGVVSVEAHVPEGARVLAANATHAWVQQIPARGLVRVSADAVQALPIRSARFGAADAGGRLWVVDVGQELTLYAEAGPPQTLFARDGLLNNTASVVSVSPGGDVWVGSIGGASRLPAGETAWQRFDREAGVPGAVIGFAFAPGAPEGTAWMLWRVRPGYGALSEWGASLLTAGAAPRHFALGPQANLEAPRSEDALAVDGLGRLWFVTQSIPRREKFLGLMTPHSAGFAINPAGEAAASGALAMHSLGHFATRGPYIYGGNGLWQNSFGVAADGAGGIILYNGATQPWRRWRP
jgi:hypothetical protein